MVFHGRLYHFEPGTLHLPARPGVPEIKVFSLQLKTPELHRDPR